MKSPSKTPVPVLPLKAMVAKITTKGNITQNDIERACGFHLHYLSRQLGHEKKGNPVSKHLMETLRIRYDFLLTGKKMVEMPPQELINSMAERLTLLSATVDVVVTELAFLIDPKNASRKKQELTTTAKAAAEMMTNEM